MPDLATPVPEAPTLDARPHALNRLVLPAIISVLVGVTVGVIVLGPIVKRRFATKSPSVTAVAADSGPAAVHLIENLVLNPAGSGGTRFLMVSVAIEAQTTVAGDEMNKRDAQLRDALLRILGQKTVEQLADVSQRDALKQEISKLLNEMLGPGAVRRIYLPQFVIQ